MDQEVRAILVGMKEELSKGWIQGKLQDRRGVCLFGAGIRTAGLQPQPMWCDGKVKGRSSVGPSYGYTIEENSPLKSALELIGREVKVPYGVLANWNDESKRTVDDIVGAIDRVLLSDSQPTTEKEEPWIETYEPSLSV